MPGARKLIPRSRAITSNKHERQGESRSADRSRSEEPAQPRRDGDADAVGTVGSPECGDMLRMWLKFKEEDGRKIIDRATFQSFGCQTAIAVASVATELLAGKTIAEAQAMSGEELAAPLGALPPVRIHCAQLVESALRSALTDNKTTAPPQPAANTSGPTLFDQLSANTNAKVKVVLNKQATS